MLFVEPFRSIRVEWPKELVYAPAFYYPATCVAVGFAIGLTEVTLLRSYRSVPR